MIPPLNEDRVYFFEQRPNSRAVGWYFIVQGGMLGPFKTEEDARQAHADYNNSEVGSAIPMKGLLRADS
jgi:hypothetical protein